MTSPSCSCSSSNTFVTGSREMSLQFGEWVKPRCNRRARDDLACTELQGFLAPAAESQHDARLTARRHGAARPLGACLQKPVCDSSTSPARSSSSFQHQSSTPEISCSRAGISGELDTFWRRGWKSQGFGPSPGSGEMIRDGARPHKLSPAVAGTLHGALVTQGVNPPAAQNSTRSQKTNRAAPGEQLCFLKTLPKVLPPSRSVASPPRKGAQGAQPWRCSKTRASRESKGHPARLRAQDAAIRLAGHRGHGSHADGRRITATGLIKRPICTTRRPALLRLKASATATASFVTPDVGGRSSRHRFKNWHGSLKPRNDTTGRTETLLTGAEFINCPARTCSAQVSFSLSLFAFQAPRTPSLPPSRGLTSLSNGLVIRDRLPCCQPWEPAAKTPASCAPRHEGDGLQPACFPGSPHPGGCSCSSSFLQCIQSSLQYIKITYFSAPRPRRGSRLGRQVVVTRSKQGPHSAPSITAPISSVQTSLRGICVMKPARSDERSLSSNEQFRALIAEAPF
ncbi:uncharacterized protein LOC142418470 [Mycteria americana]|uniref:uncharacterized protein LOC142418470 n=1 Tax=Mycteria americana TaxID=33587 RepID=UPI003F5846A2